MVSALAATPDGLWVGTYKGGLARFHQGQWQSYTTKNSALPHDTVWRLAATPDGLWVSTEGGLARFHKDQWQSYTAKNSALPMAQCGRWKRHRTGSGSARRGG